MVLHNYMNFVDLKDYLYLAYYLSVDGHLIQAGQQNLKDGIPAGCDGVVDLPISGSRERKVLPESSLSAEPCECTAGRRRDYRFR